MSHSEALALLIPLNLGGVYTTVLTVEGASLDTVATAAGTLLSEMRPDLTNALLARWESVYGLTALPGETLANRQTRLQQKLLALGRLDKAFFIELAAGYGVTITVQELQPFMVGWSGSGDETGDADSDWCWRVWSESGPGYYFRAGEAGAGEELSAGWQMFLEELFRELKPADTFVEFIQV